VRFLRVMLLLLPFGVGVLSLNCSKKSEPPTAPPSPNPACSLSPSTLNFDTVTIGASTDRQFTLTNTGTGTLAGTVSSPCGEFAVVGPAAYSLTAGQSATLTIRFTPTTTGTRACTIATGSALCVAVACNGTGQSATPACAVSAQLVDFGNVDYGASQDRSFTIQNVGGGTLSGTVSGTTGNFSLVSQPAFGLGPSQSATMTVRFTPAYGGAQACTLSLGPTGCSAVICRANGILPTYGHCSLQPVTTTIDFGEVSVGFTAERYFTIRNSDQTYIAHGSIGGPIALCPEFELPVAGPFELFPGDSTRVPIRFTPSREGLQLCDFPIACEMLGSGLTAGINHYLTGRGVGVGGTPQCQLSATILDFGQVVVGETKDLSLTVSNTGTGPLSGIAGPSHCSVFSFVGPVAYNLGPGQSTMLTLRFTPTEIGHTITCSEIPMGLACAPLTAIGAGVAPPSCALSTTILDFGTVPVGQSKDLTFDLENSGGGTLCGSITESCADFAVIQNASYCITPPGFVRVTVRFSPTTTGFQECTLSPGSNCPAITVRGTGG
jgi:hypothetical protein